MTMRHPEPGTPVWAHHEATVGGVRLHYVEAGTGPLVVLLHGFPEFWYEWRHQIPALAAAGFRVIAPDLRGYNTSDKPRGVGSYRVEALVEDVAGLVRHAGEERAHVAGHDWGGVVAWYLAMLRPGTLDRLVIVNAPHPARFGRELRMPDQMLRSAYAGFFQLPWLPEAVIRARDFALLERAFRNDPARPGAFTDEDIRRYKEALAHPGALTATLNYYRAAARHRPPRARRITAPTLLVWGEKDPHLVVRLAEGVEEWVPGIRVERLPGVGHWVPAEVPERLNRLMIDFLRGG
ncbi:MAG TPA: alpha/beta hydrolase [Longimicrobiaceae bacterium]|nr:alpha/beta hydrolase [Longimicrobiaceae bacterium]